MPLTPIGSAVTERLTFNSGKVDFGNGVLVDVDNATVSMTFTEKELRRLNSIKMATHKRATFKCGLKFKVKSFSPALYAACLGTTTPESSAETISVLDGQQPALSYLTLTAYVDDNVAQPIQFQFSNAICTAIPFAASLEAFGEYDISFEATDVSVYYFSTT
jgi:hypothetical protein